MKSRFIDKIITRMDRLDPGSLQSHFLRLAQEKGLMETILQAVQEGVIVINERGQINYANISAEKLLGFDIESAEGDPIKRYLPGIDWTSLLSMDEHEWSRLMSRELEINYPEHRFLTFYVVPLSTADPDTGGAVLLLRDVTKERMNTAQTIETERLHAITLLAASVAHEIGNPLNSLTIHLQLLERELKDLDMELTDDLQDLVHVATQEVTRLDQIITQFLSALRPVPPKLKSVYAERIVEQTLRFMKQEIESRNIHVMMDIPSGLPAILGDTDQLRQAFFNIIKNAMQAMTEDGHLEITAEATDRFVVLSFKDDGAGFSPENIGKIFEPFHTTKDHGSGLGLMIVQRIRRDHGGEIEIHSEPGRGATISLFLTREDQRVRMLQTPAIATEGRVND